MSPAQLALAVLAPCLLFCSSALAQEHAARSTSPPAYLPLLDHGAIDVEPNWVPDQPLQDCLDSALATLGLSGLVERGKLGVTLVELSELEHPRLAGVNAHRSFYAASVPKLGVLHAAFQAERDGKLILDREMRRTLTNMIRVSSNRDASVAIKRLGFPYIASVMWQSGMYDPERGGLWIGKAYGGEGDRWHRDPIANQSHGASPVSLAKLLTLLAQERLVDAEASRAMKAMLAEPGIHHKFVRGLKDRPGSRIYRKSGSWSRWHGDAALVERGGRRYVAVALCESERGSAILEQLILVLDDCASPASAAGG